MKAEQILLLGATGFVGQHLLWALQNHSLETHVIARHAHILPIQPGVHYHATSLDDTACLTRILPHCQTVIHLASASTPGSSALQPVFEAEHIILPTLRFLEVLQDYPSIHLIYLSSGGAVYGNTDHPFIPEQTTLSPLSYYGASKVAIEQFIQAFCQQLHRPATILRPSNFYGPGQPYRPGFGIIPTIFHHLRIQKPLSIWGDGNIIRDYLYIDDLTRLCEHLITHHSSNNTVKIYNVGAGQGHSLNQLCELIEEVTGQKIQRNYQTARQVDVRRVVLDCHQVCKDHQWFPKINLKTGLKLTWEWFQHHGE